MFAINIAIVRMVLNLHSAQEPRETEMIMMPLDAEKTGETRNPNKE